MTAPLQSLLFGGAEVPMTEAAKRRPQTRQQGYGGTPGLGPAGETCGSCAHRIGRVSGNGRTYWKCLLLKRQWTATPESDIRVRSPACEQWSPEPDDAGTADGPPVLPMRKKARRRRKTKGPRQLPERLE